MAELMGPGEIGPFGDPLAALGVPSGPISRRLLRRRAGRAPLRGGSLRSRSLTHITTVTTTLIGRHHG